MKLINEKLFSTRFPNNYEEFDKMNDVEKSNYLKLYSTYSDMLYKFIINNTSILEFEEKIVNNKYGYVYEKIQDSSKDMYQYMADDRLNFLYLRNNLRIDRLSKEDLEFLSSKSNGYEYDKECDEFIKRTYQDIILLNKVEGPTTKDTRYNYGPGFTDAFYAKNESVVIGARYKEEDKIIIPDDIYTPSKPSYISNILNDIETTLEKELKISVRGIKYNEDSIITIEDIETLHK